jgi:hypothetical protein
MGLLRRDKKPPAEESPTESNIAYAAVQGRNGSAQEAEDRQNKGIDIDMIDPQEIVRELEGLAHYDNYVYETVPEVDEKGKPVYESVPALDGSGKVVYQDVPVNANGTVLVMKQTVMVQRQKTVKALVKRSFTRAWAIAALGYLNKVWPTICMSPYEADTTKIRLRTSFHDIRKTMTFDEKQRYGIILKMVRDLCLARCEDMKDAQKALLLKVKRDDLSVHLSRGNGAGVGGK